jgi:ABC-type antimicrobial peptide transport system permease subunit
LYNCRDLLATVTERTREIGIRRALGGKRSDITQQFLVETISLSVVGGLTGVLGGLLCPWVVFYTRHFVQRFAPDFYADLPEVAKIMSPQIVPASIPIAFFISVVVGVIFGIYPAIRAAQMDPIDALRHE